MKKTILLSIVLVILLVVYNVLSNNFNAKISPYQMQEYLKSVYTPNNLKEMINAKKEAIAREDFTETAANRFFITSQEGTELTEQDKSRVLITVTYVGLAKNQYDKTNKYKVVFTLVGDSTQNVIKKTLYFYTNKKGTIIDFKFV